MTTPTSRTAVVIPCFRVRDHILAVLSAIGPEVDRIYCIDDACPDRSGAFIAAHCTDPRVTVLTNAVNLGVGGATLAGYRQALTDGAQVIVKLDGDGQMDPVLIPRIMAPVLTGRADYAKGNRFYHPAGLSNMPKARLIGNLALSFLTKFSSGYWTLLDPTNGFTAIHATVLSHLPFERISQRFFFESDLLYWLNLLNAVVFDVPMPARYGTETSNLKISRIIPEFAIKHLLNASKRIFFKYFLRDFPFASLELIFGILLTIFGTAVGLYAWIESALHGVFASAGTVMLAALPSVIGLQFLLSFLHYDIASVPRVPLQQMLASPPPSPSPSPSPNRMP
jgi:dolichol-phosphate mannosyltransferase